MKRLASCIIIVFIAFAVAVLSEALILLYLAGLLLYGAVTGEPYSQVIALFVLLLLMAIDLNCRRKFGKTLNDKIKTPYS